MTPILATLLTDTREQQRQAYQFLSTTSKHVTFATEFEPLPIAGYAARLPGEHRPGVTAIVARRTVGDLLGDLTHGRQEFERQLEKLQHYGFAALVIEGDIPALAVAKGSTGQVNPRSIVGSLVAVSERYGIHVVFGTNRQLAEAYTFRLLERWVRDRADDQGGSRDARPVG